MCRAAGIAVRLTLRGRLGLWGGVAELIEQPAGASHHVVTAVDVEDFAGDAVAGVAQQERAGPTDFFVADVTPQGGHVFVHGQHFFDAGGAAREGSDGAGGDGVDADIQWAHVEGEVADGGVEGGFADPHDVVTGDALFAAEVGHRRDGAAGVEEVAGGGGDGDQGVDADIHRQFETGPAGEDGVAGEVIAVGEGDRMEQEVDLAEFFFGRLHHRVDVFVLLGVHGDEEGGPFVMVGQLGDAAAIPLAFVIGSVGEVGEAAGPAGVHDLLGDRPGDRVVVGNAENKPFFTCEIHSKT